MGTSQMGEARAAINKSFPLNECFFPTLEICKNSRSTLVSRNLNITGHRTSVRLEPEMWAALKDIARREGTTMHNICSLVALRKVPESSLTAAIRVFLMLYYRAAATEAGHAQVGHGCFDVMKRRAKVTGAMLGGNTTS